MRFRIFAFGNALLMITLALSGAVNAQTESTLYTFKETTSFWPQGALSEDSAGNLYGTTRAGGTYGVGTIFKMAPPTVSGGAWTLTTLYNFVPYGNGGFVPVSDLIADSTGAFYGTTYSGGDPVCNCGVVYKLIPPAKSGGAWTEQGLYAFTGNSDGRLPAMAALTMNSQGVLYGVTVRGGTWDSGVIYQLAPAPAEPIPRACCIPLAIWRMQALQTAPSRWILPAHSTESHLWAALSTAAPSTSS